jgi:hypothetical protein
MYTHKDNVYQYILLFETNFYHLYLRIVIKDTLFVYCFNLTFKDINKYYGLKNISGKCVKYMFKNKV